MCVCEGVSVSCLFTLTCVLVMSKGGFALKRREVGVGGRTCFWETLTNLRKDRSGDDGS